MENIVGDNLQYGHCFVQQDILCRYVTLSNMVCNCNVKKTATVRQLPPWSIEYNIIIHCISHIYIINDGLSA